MNIFYLDRDPILAAHYLNDSHCVKMIVESCQLLANLFTLEQLATAPPTQLGNTRKHSYFNHPCAKWVRESPNNANWLIIHANAMLGEFADRFKKRHFSSDFLWWVAENYKLGDWTLHTDPFLAMPDEYKTSSPVQSYRNYYVGAKQHLAKWTNRPIPSWYEIKSENNIAARP